MFGHKDLNNPFTFFGKTLGGIKPTDSLIHTPTITKKDDALSDNPAIVGTHTPGMLKKNPNGDALKPSKSTSNLSTFWGNVRGAMTDYERTPSIDNRLRSQAAASDSNLLKGPSIPAYRKTL